MIALVTLALCVCLNYPGLEFIQKFTYIPCNHILVYRIYSAHPLFSKVFLYFLVLVSCLITCLSLGWLTRIPVAGGQVVHMSIDTKHINPENLLEQNRTRSDSRNIMLCECCPSEFPGHLDLRQSERKEHGCFTSCDAGCWDLSDTSLCLSVLGSPLELYSRHTANYKFLIFQSIRI